ncbi:MAG: PAS domain S-box protein [Proteobacteria bacterium]|nr:PAS domain S-box protein [Pseudomonadota bacterium]MBU1687810.1 PAS domain S-box protein [Pseudomonadota bacterium]
MDTNKLIIENAADAIITVNDQMEINTWNPSAEKVFGYRFAEVEGMPFCEIFPCDSEEKSGILPPGKGEPFEVLKERSIIHQSGKQMPVEFRISYVRSQKGMIYLVFAREITNRWLREKKLTQSYQNQRIMNSILTISLMALPLEEQLDLILDQILAIPTIDLLPNGAILLTDQNILSLNLKTFRNFSAQQINTCSSVPFGKCHCGRAALSGEIQFVECIDSSHDFVFDKMSPHGHYCVPITTEDKVLGVIALYIKEGHQRNMLETDTLKAISNILAGIIERKKMETRLIRLVDSLRETIGRVDDEKKFNESVILSLSSGLLVLDHNDCIEKCNPAGLHLIGNFCKEREEEGLAGLKLVDVFGPEATQITALDDFDNPARRELKLTAKDGGSRIIEYVSVPREDASGNKLGTIISFDDVTGLKKIQAEMEKMNRFSTIAEIASAVAHEVRNPLAGIRTMSQAIGEQLDDNDEKKEYITRVIKQVDRLNLLLTDFFTYARPPEPKREKTSPVKIIDEIKPLVHNRLFKFGITLQENYAKDLPKIMVDPNQIQQVFLNLMLNAIDAVKNNGTSGKIEVKTEYIGLDRSVYNSDQYTGLDDLRKYVLVTFKDNGCGIPQELAEKIFEPFFTTKHDGSGLGLAIVYRILKENNAGIYLARKAGPGTSFVMFFSIE